ncbi:MAG: hypothetical protein ACRC1H_19495, partial [Caldilineaceae bacterium]
MAAPLEAQAAGVSTAPHTPPAPSPSLAVRVIDTLWRFLSDGRTLALLLLLLLFLLALLVVFPQMPGQVR